MSSRDHARTFVASLAQAPPWDPVPHGLAALEAVDAAVLVELVGLSDQLRVGHGAVHMHRRHLGDTPRPDLPGVPDFEALVLCAASLRAGRLPSGPTTAEAWVRAAGESPRWCANLLRMEPDLLDEILLEISGQTSASDHLRAALQAQADTLRAAGADLHRQAADLLGERRTLMSTLRGLVGAGPDLAQGLWVRWLRAILLAWLLEAKG